MEFKEISKEEVRVGDWFECIRLSNRKQKIPRIDRDKHILKTITGHGGDVELSLDDPEITFYRNVDNPPSKEPVEKTETEINKEEKAKEEVKETATEEQIQKVRDHLDNIDGIGPAKIDELIESGYDTIETLRDADIEDLTKVNGIGESKAKEIKLSLIQ